MRIGTAFIFGICTLLAATAWAEEEKEPAGKRPEGRPGARRPGGPGGEAFREAMLKRFDKDGDGKLSDEEKATAMKERGAGRPEGKGGRGPAGRGPGGPGGFAELMKKFDKDGDGKLSDDEKAAAREAMPKRGRPGGRRPGGEKKPE